MADLSVLASDLDHPEGVAWSPAGWIACGGEAGQIYRIDPHSGASTQIAETGGFALGMAFDAAGLLYVCDMGRHAVVRVDPATGLVDDITTGHSETQVRVPNYPVFSADGYLFFSDSGDWAARDGLIFVRHPSGRVSVATKEAGGYANGLAIDPTGHQLYVVETSIPRISRFELLGDGALGPRETVVDLPDTVPDGIAFTANGTLLISCYRPDAIFLWDGHSVTTLVNDRTGLMLSAPTNTAFFGPDLNRLVSANLAGRNLVEVTTDLTGAALNYPTVEKTVNR
jgi:gluconolactonase